MEDGLAAAPHRPGDKGDEFLRMNVIEHPARFVGEHLWRNIRADSYKLFAHCGTTLDLESVTRQHHANSTPILDGELNKSPSKCAEQVRVSGVHARQVTNRVPQFLGLRSL